MQLPHAYSSQACQDVFKVVSKGKKVTKFLSCIPIHPIRPLQHLNPGCAKSELEKSLITRDAHDDLMLCAVKAYNLELKKPYHQRHGLHRVCLDFEKLNYEVTGTYIKLSHATLCRLANGGRTPSKAHADRAWLTDAKTNVIINFIIEMADRGFPLSHCWLKEHVDVFCHSRLGDAFLEKSVGINWTYR